MNTYFGQEPHHFFILSIGKHISYVWCDTKNVIKIPWIQFLFAFPTGILCLRPIRNEQCREKRKKKTFVDENKNIGLYRIAAVCKGYLRLDQAEDGLCALLWIENGIGIILLEYFFIFLSMTRS